MGHFKLVSATTRVRTAHTGMPFPTPSSTATGGVDYITTYEMTVSAVSGNGGTVYLYFPPSAVSTRPQRGALERNQTMLALVGGESVTFAGPTVGSGDQRELIFGTGRSYVFGSATSQRIAMNYVKMV